MLFRSIQDPVVGPDLVVGPDPVVGPVLTARMFPSEANRLKEAILREYLGMGWLLKMSLRRFGEAVFETDKTLTPFRAPKVSKRVYYEGVNFICRKGVKCVDYLQFYLL